LKLILSSFLFSYSFLYVALFKLLRLNFERIRFRFISLFSKLFGSTVFQLKYLKPTRRHSRKKNFR